MGKCRAFRKRSRTRANDNGSALASTIETKHVRKVNEFLKNRAHKAKETFVAPQR